MKKKLSPQQQLVKIRKQLHLTQNEAAEMIGITQQSLSRIESNKASVSVSTLERILEAYGCQLTITNCKE